MTTDDLGLTPPADDGMFCTRPKSAQNSESVKPTCGAKTRNGGTCRQAPAPGRTRCRLHGGASKRGTEHGRFKSGMYAKALHRDLRAEYERLLAHPGLLSARSDIALLRVRLNQLAGRLDTGESGRRWGDVRTAFTEFRQASNAGDSGRMIAALNRLDALVTGAGDVEGAYADLAALIERVSTIAAREHRMIVEERLTVSAEDVRVLVASIADAVLTHVQDPAARLAIVERIQALSVLNNEELATVAGRTLHTHTTVNPTDADSEL